MGIGFHWAFLQSLAWTTMLADHLRTESFVVSVKKTFDGAHPCRLCKQIAAGKHTEEKKSEVTFPVKKLEFVSSDAVFVFGTFQEHRLLPASPESLTALAQKPPV